MKPVSDQVRPARLVAVFVVLLVLAGAAADASLARAQVPPPEQTEVRALWVDAFHDGLKSPEQIQRLVADARRANVNTLLVQVRRRGDVYYLGGPEPLATDQAANFDALRTLLDLAHGGTPRLEVQAWIPVYPVWGNQASPPADPSHPFHRHGPNAAGDDNWLMLRDDGQAWTGEGYWLDPGHPAVADYLVGLCSDLVRRYELDGLHLDRLRYFEGESVSGGIRDRRWGYNPASVMRFDLAYGRVGQPDPNDPLWVQFRRDQVTQLLQRIREAAIAARPDLKISAAVVPWGYGPRSTADWVNTAAYRFVFQDWRAWLEQGLLDQAYAMTYARDASPVQAAMLDSWLAWLRSHTYGRQVISGLALYLNEPADSIRQVRRALAAEPSGARLAGVALYSYAAPDPTRANADPADDSADGLLWNLLTQPLAENGYSPPFGSYRSVPTMSWRQ